MRELFEKYYTVRLYSQPDTHFRPDIKELPGEFDTPEEARAFAEPYWHEYDWVSDVTGNVCNWWEIQVLYHYRKIER